MGRSGGPGPVLRYLNAAPQRPQASVSPCLHRTTSTFSCAHQSVSPSPSLCFLAAEPLQVSCSVPCAQGGPRQRSWYPPPAPRQHCSPWPIVRDPGRGGKQLVDPLAPRERITANYSHFDSGRFCCSAPSGLQSGANRAAPHACGQQMHTCSTRSMHVSNYAYSAVAGPSWCRARRSLGGCELPSEQEVTQY